MSYPAGCAFIVKSDCAYCPLRTSSPVILFPNGESGVMSAEALLNVAVYESWVNVPFVITLTSTVGYAYCTVRG